MTKEQLSIFDKQFWQAVADNRIKSIAEAKRYAIDWISTAMSNNTKEMQDENARAINALSVAAVANNRLRNEIRAAIDDLENGAKYAALSRLKQALEQ